MKLNVTIEDVPNSINTTIKPIDEYNATAEIEKSELVFNPNTLTLHKALGKSHAKGGTPVNLENGSFIFSNYNKLKFNNDDKKEMGFQSNKTKKTPSQVLENELAGGLKHHNSMVNILKNENNYDPIAQRTAQLMLDKNLNKIGRVAFKQEEIKGFPDGLPRISNGTAPVINDELLKRIEMTKQYQNGGLVKYQNGKSYTYDTKQKSKFKDPLYGTDKLLTQYLDNQKKLSPEYDDIMLSNDPLRKKLFNLRTRQTNSLYSPFVSDALKNDKWNINNELAKNINYDVSKLSEDDINTNYIDATKDNNSRWGQDRLYTYQKHFDDLEGRNNYIKEQGFIPVQGQPEGYFKKEAPDGSYTGAILSYNKPLPVLNKVTSETNDRLNQQITSLNQPLNLSQKQTPVDNVTPVVKTEDDGTFNSTDYNIGLTPWQKLMLSKGMVDALGVKSYMPIRQHQESVLTKPTLISDQPGINQANRAYYNAARLNQIYSTPQMSIAANKQLAGTRLDQINDIIGQTQNQNVGIINQSQERNASILNNDAAINRQNDANYYDKVITGLQNKDDEKEIKWGNVINEANQYFAEAQTMNNTLNSQKQYKTEVRDKNGNIIGYRGALPYEPKKGFFGYGFKYNPNINAKALLQANLGTSNNDVTSKMNELLNRISKNPSMTKEQAADYMTQYNILKTMSGQK